ncbi:MAG: DUF4957 domain-containing protein [Paludibacteraceae bacterium]|nr:DUF4957 domain-containing protein [Paludibacteraceae bacterium]
MKKIFLFVAALCATAALNAKTITLEPGKGVIKDAIETASAGDIIELTGDASSEYTEGNSIALDKAITIRAAQGATPVVHMMKMKTNAALTIDGVEFYGYEDYLFRTETGGEFDVVFRNSTFRDCSARFYYLSDGQTINSVTIDNCIIKNFGFTEQPAIYGLGTIKSFEMKNTTVMNCAGSYPIRVYSSEHVLIDHCTIYNVGKQAIRLVENSRGTSDVLVSNTVVASSTAQTDYAYYIYNGAVKNCVYYNTGSYRSDNATAEKLVNADPKFVNAAEGNFNFTAESPLKGAATDGSNIGDPRWKEAQAEMVFSFITPATNYEEAVNDYEIQFSVVVPEGDATYSIDYSYDGETWLPIVNQKAYTNQTSEIFATRGLQAGAVTLRATLATTAKTVVATCPNALTIVKDTEAPRAIANFDANAESTTATLTWQNPTHEIPVMGSLLGEENLLEYAKSFVPNGDNAVLAEENDALKMTISTTAAWHQTGVEFDVKSFGNVQNVAFKIKGDGVTQIEVMLILDGSYWWASSAFVPGTDWETHKITEFKHVDWHDQCPYKALTGDHVTGVAIEVDNGTAVTDAVFYLDSVMTEGTIAPSKYYAKTIIRRSTEDYPETIKDGDAVYEGTAETTTNEIDPSKTYYYAAFAVDDLGNVAAPANLKVEGTAVTYTLFNVTVPAGTNACYLVGSFNSWEVEEGIEMTKVDDTHYTYQATKDWTDATYRYYHGDESEMAEVSAEGTTVTRTVNAATMNDTVANWNDAYTKLEPLKADKVATKMLRKGQLVIKANNVLFNALGTAL